MQFTGYKAGWNTCPECGMRLVRVGDNLRHRKGWLKIHELVVRRKAEYNAPPYRKKAKKWAEENLTEPILIPDITPEQFWKKEANR